jgi:hypothetical protein
MVLTLRMAQHRLLGCESTGYSTPQTTYQAASRLTVTQRQIASMSHAKTEKTRYALQFLVMFTTQYPAAIW